MFLNSEYPNTTSSLLYYVNWENIMNGGSFTSYSIVVVVVVPVRSRRSNITFSVNDWSQIHGMWHMKDT